MSHESERLVDQVKKNAAWWREEVRAGRVDPARHFELLLHDLELAGGTCSAPAPMSPERLQELRHVWQDEEQKHQPNVPWPVLVVLFGVLMFGLWKMQ